MKQARRVPGKVKTNKMPFLRKKLALDILDESCTHDSHSKTDWNQNQTLLTRLLYVSLLDQTEFEINPV